MVEILGPFTSSNSRAGNENDVDEREKRGKVDIDNEEE